MSWGQYHPNQGGPGPDPYGRTSASSEPGGYITHDPYAPPGYHQAGHGSSGYGHYGYPYQFQYDPAHPPRPAVGFAQAIKLFFKNYAVFHGRASRSEFWWVSLGFVILAVLLVIPVIAVAAVQGAGSEPPVILGIYMILVMALSLGLVVPSISLQVRRLHDAGFSGFFSIFAYVPYLNSITFLVPLIMSILPSKPEGVKYDHPNGSQPATL